MRSASRATRRSRKLTVTRIVTWYAWGDLVVAQFLDARGAASVGGLCDDALAELAERLLRLEDCAQEGYDPPDIPPAR